MNVYTMVVVRCGNCGIEFGVDKSLDDQWRQGGDTWYCPNGHAQVYRKTEVSTLREKVEQLERETAWKSRALETARRSRSSMKGQVTRIKRRISNGVCPCCKRTFKNLERHMKSQHPDFAPEGKD